MTAKTITKIERKRRAILNYIGRGEGLGAYGRVNRTANGLLDSYDALKAILGSHHPAWQAYCDGHDLPYSHTAIHFFRRP